MSTLILREAMRKRYPMPEWVLLEEVRDAAGFGGNRSADGIAMNTWPSRGLEIHGLELKASRSDWLRELKNPAKAEAIAGYCDRWWIVALPEVVKLDELPRTWGLLVCDKGGCLRVVRDAPQNENVTALNRTFVAAMMRRCGQVDESIIHQRINKEAESARKLEKERADRDIHSATSSYREMKDKLKQIQDETGVDLLNWRYTTPDIIAALKFALASHDLAGRYRGLSDLRDMLEKTIKGIDACAQHLPQQPEAG